MKTLYPCPAVINNYVKQLFFKLFVVAIVMACTTTLSFAQELVFQNPQLEIGTAGADGAVYRFSNVLPNIDALVKINCRSDDKVGLSNIDMDFTGHNKAFQPQVIYDKGSTPNGTTRWWMEFQVSFVKATTNTAVQVTSFDVTALDIDGNGDKLSENVSFYGLSTYTLESITSLKVEDIKESGVRVGKLFEGPTDHYVDVDTSATKVMATLKYLNTNSFKMRTGAESKGNQCAAERMYSFWFKSFKFQTPVVLTLPVVLSGFSAKLVDTKVQLNWATDAEINNSHFVVEKSYDNKTFSDAAIIFSNGNSNTKQLYAYNDKLTATDKGVIYYRLKMVDKDGEYKNSAVKAVKTGTTETLAVSIYPNPVVNELRVTIPANWQQKQISLQLINTNGQVVKQVQTPSASQTELVDVRELKPAVYIIRAVNGEQVITQKIVKAN
jgi:Secretion system C-terminal sorting domain